jgi:hypothetical protein
MSNPMNAASMPPNPPGSGVIAAMEPTGTTISAATNGTAWPSEANESHNAVDSDSHPAVE